MPIRPENLHHYRGQAWKAVRAQILERAGNRCEGSPAYPDCRAQNGQAHPETGSKVVLTIAHLDHNPANNAPENLRAWCQRCHNKFDAPMRTDSVAKAADLYYDLPAKEALWREVMEDARRLLSKSMRGYTDAKFLNMDPFVLRERLDAAGRDSGRRWVALALQLPEFPATNNQAYFRLIALQRNADAGFESARVAFYGK